jgi:hypothetical protein
MTIMDSKASPKDARKGCEKNGGSEDRKSGSLEGPLLDPRLFRSSEFQRIGCPEPLLCGSSVFIALW